MLDRYRSDIRNVLVGLVIGFGVWALADFVGVDSAPIIGFVVGLLGLGALEVHERREQIRQRTPFTIRSPIARKNLRSAVPLPRTPGRLDFELDMQRAADASTALLNKIGDEMRRNAGRLDKETARVQRSEGKSIERRHRAVGHSGVVIRKHASRLARLEAGYRSQITAMVDNSKRILESSDPTEDMSMAAAATLGWRESAVGARTSTVRYQDTVRTQRATNIHQEVNSAAEELIAVLDRIIEDAGTVIAYCDWALHYMQTRDAT
jgi:hypothetical protein